MRRVLIQLCHPAFERSRIGRALFSAVRDLEGVTANDLYEAYPDFLIDTPREQELLREHDAIVFLHPFYWYSSPALLKEWQDLVLEHGFAFGGGHALRGKLWWSAISAGGERTAYRAEGSNRFELRQLLTPFEQTARLCEMRFLTPFAVFGAHRLVPGSELDAIGESFAGWVRRLRDEDVVPHELRAPGILDACARTHP